jgi:hypothetical protein
MNLMILKDRGMSFFLATGNREPQRNARDRSKSLFIAALEALSQSVVSQILLNG